MSNIETILSLKQIRLFLQLFVQSLRPKTPSSAQFLYVELNVFADLTMDSREETYLGYYIGSLGCSLRDDLGKKKLPDLRCNKWKKLGLAPVLCASGKLMV